MTLATSSLDQKRLGLRDQFWRKLIVHAGAFVSLTIVCLALWVLYHTLEEIHVSDVLYHFRTLPASSLILAFLVTAASYLVVTVYDVLALHYINRRLPYPRAALAAFLASAFGNNIGFSLVTGGSVRYRIYSPAGLSALQVAGVTTMCSLTTMLGMGFIFTLSMLLGTGEVTESVIHMSPELRRTIGGIALALIAGYVAFISVRPVTIRTRSWSLQLPSAKITLAQISLATIDLMLVGTLIYVLLPMHGGTNFLVFLGVFALAMIAGSMSNVPGGIGVFETVLLLGLPEIPPAALLGSILLFRCVYYLLPLSVAAVMFAIHEAILQRTRFERARDTLIDWLAELGPEVMAVLIVFAGVVLLFSGAIPIPAERLALIESFLPLPALETSHMLGGAAGLGVIILARSLSRRLNTAYHLTVILLGLGIVASLLRGLDYVDAVGLGIIFFLLLLTRAEFQRRGSLFDQGFPVEWVSTLTVILAVTVWLGLFSYKHFDYANELWWQFAYDADFSRFLRTTLLVFTLAGGVTLVNLLRPDPEPLSPGAIELDRVGQIIKKHPDTHANLALLGDKRLLFSDSGNAFIMYQVQGKSWIALGDPVGPKDEYAKLLWAFRELCDRYGGWPGFYLVDAEHLPLYVGLELSVLKLGDEARVPLETFSVDGLPQAELREVHLSILEQGARFEMVDSTHVPTLIPDLKTVSDNWLSETKTREKGFSKGFFDPDYLANFPCALVRKDHRILAFASVWPSANKEQLALDLLRYHHDAPKGILDYLIVEVMLAGQEQRYRWFNLGMAPHSRLADHPLAPLWHRVGRLMYRHSEHFQDAESHRRYAEKFNPVWRSKYLVSRGGVNLPRIMRDIAKLIAHPGI